METWDYIKSSVSIFHTFDNYYNEQSQVMALRQYCMEMESDWPTIISSKSGNGVTHILHAICNKWISNSKSAFCITSQSIVYLIKKIKTDLEWKKLQSHLLSFELLAIDNIQFLYKKAVRYTRFVLEMINKCKEIKKPLFIGCSQPEKDFTKSKTFSLLHNRIDLKPLPSINVFRTLKNLCEYEPLIPDHLLYEISGYNGTMREYINCLISIRFKSKLDGVDLHSIKWEEIETKLNIKKYFQKQQFRKCFNLGQLALIENKMFFFESQ